MPKAGVIFTSLKLFDLCIREIKCLGDVLWTIVSVGVSFELILLYAEEQTVGGKFDTQVFEIAIGIIHTSLRVRMTQKSRTHQGQSKEN